MKLISFLLPLLFFAQISLAGSNSLNLIPVVPDEILTPGDFCDESDRDFKEFRYAEKMPYCKRNVSTNSKTRIYEQYKVAIKCKHRYTIDHFVPLALGGNNDQKNLWPEHVLVKATREKLEMELYHAVDQGQISLDEAVQIIVREKTQLELDLSHVEGCG